MDADQLLLMLLVCGGAYFAGYRELALGILLIVGVVFLVSGTKKDSQYYALPAGGVRVHGAEMLEPIIIETTKGAPFRIPANMDMRINPTWGAFDMVEKATLKGAGSLARMVHGLAFGRKWE